MTQRRSGAIFWRAIGRPARTSGKSSGYRSALCSRLVSEPETRTEDMVVATKWAALTPPAPPAEPEAQGQEIALWPLGSPAPRSCQRARKMRSGFFRSSAVTRTTDRNACRNGGVRSCSGRFDLAPIGRGSSSCRSSSKAASPLRAAQLSRRPLAHFERRASAKFAPRSLHIVRQLPLAATALP